jgi:hypothetical protein
VDEQKRKRHEEMLRRLDSTNELIGRPAAGRDANEDERQQQHEGLPHQLSLARFELAVVPLRAGSNVYEDLAPLMDEAVAALSSTAPGTVTRVPDAPR